MELSYFVSALTLTPWIAALVPAIVGRTALGANATARISAVVVGVGFASAVALSPPVFAAGPTSVGLDASTLRVDSAALILALLVLGLSALIQVFAIRYLRGDSRQNWFAVHTNLLTGFTVLMVCAGSVAVFAVGWIGAGASLLLLLAMYWPLPQAREGVRRTGIRLLIADAPFLVGIAILLNAGKGDVPFTRLSTVLGSAPPLVPVTVAVLLAAAALSRSSQVPFHGWLPFTLAAPTPVSALMHAGVVNAGAILVLRFAPAITIQQPVMIALFLSGAATTVYASTVRRVRADVKGRLVFSTMAQMGFMIMACGLGLFGAAIFHLVAHSLFKSALFLGAGTGVRQHAVDRDLPVRGPRSRMTVAVAVTTSGIVTVLAVTAAKVILSPTATPATLGLLAFVALTASVTLASMLSTHASWRTVVTGLIMTLGLTFAYIAALGVVTATLSNDNAANPAPAWLLVLPGLGLVAAQFLSSSPKAPARLRDFIYTRSLVTTARRPTSTTGVRS